ncbi:YfbU family protein [Providencia rettgeri]|uniref:YfbU family protein n=1 Tax=Providencia TaxID=586 RepID=UPI00155E7162|nr:MULTISPECIES: YfbU family protein [Providencia]EJD6377281.1 YfbU family protein [Providencia rettgeri]ELR5106991.1 YfbU family protein [Providencia rettgeri]ELR5117754.1 YfbU family protein [Providencia rettgeri]ELR5125470.1 YfbU family protein [Providencia rettgeri]ELR5198718.1 YfbU family protein [Providencia rettgeri]
MEKIDKLNTLMLCDIIEHLKINTELDAELIRYAITSGNDWILNSEYGSLLNIDAVKKEEVDYVVNILNMYRGLSAALKKFSIDVKKKLISNYRLKIIDCDIQIPGFDGNNESQYINIVEGFLKTDRFSEQKEPIANTHSNTTAHYRAMLSEYEKLNAPMRRFEITEDEFINIISKSPYGL